MKNLKQLEMMEAERLLVIEKTMTEKIKRDRENDLADLAAKQKLEIDEANRLLINQMTETEKMKKTK